MEKEKVLEVKNLTISFRTPNGLVRAVRDVSFDLHKGETLAIVGESGSGKSVTNRAVMGILSANAIIDGGQIMYNNQDLTKLSEANFHLIRGNKIGMIFQDPLSALNPIMKIGKQITEAMLVNGNRIHNRFMDLFHKEYHDYLNMVTRIKLAQKEWKIRLFEFRTDPEITPEIRREKVALAHEKYKSEVAQFRGQIPALKEKYLTSKSRAKDQVRDEKAQFKAEKKAALAVLHAEFKAKMADVRQMPNGSQAFREGWEQIKNLQKKIAENAEQFRRRIRVTKREAREKAIQIMNEVGIPEPDKRFNQYPFQFSGGMRQRIVIAIALTANPEILICDEPTTALDVTIQRQILNLIKQIKTQRDLSVIFITHDLGVVANMADRVAVMYAGKIVEYGTLNEIFYDPKHPYTWALLSSAPDLETKGKLISIPGTPPDMLFPPKGDAFAERNKYALKIDYEEMPPFFKVSDTHFAATWLLHPDAPKIEIPAILMERIARYHEIEGQENAKADDKMAGEQK